MSDRSFMDNTLLICPSAYKNQLLEYYALNKMITDIKFETLESYQKNYFFDYDVKAIKYLKDHYHLSIPNAKELLHNLYYIDEKQDYSDEKLQRLVVYKKELIEHDCLIFNPLFRKMIQKKTVVVAGYGKLEVFYQKMLEGKTVEVWEEPINAKKMEYYEFFSMEQEVEFVYNQIFDLLEKGVDINHIYLMNASDEYEPYLEQMNGYYPFTIETKRKDCLGSTTLGKNFLRMIKENEDKETIVQYLLAQQSLNAQTLLDLLNRYCEYDLIEMWDFFYDDLKHLTLDSVNFTNVVKQVDLTSRFTEEDYVFMVGFNDQCPPMKKDIDYISDSLAKILGLNTTEEKNQIAKENCRRALSNIENLTLSYCKTSPFTKYQPSTMLDEQFVKREYEFSYSYSEQLNQDKYAYLLDQFRKYHTQETDLALLRYNYQDYPYLSFEHAFTPLQESAVKTIDHVQLSYSSLNTFYQCQFRYYLQYVLKIDEYTSSFKARMGTISHDVLMDYCQKGRQFDFDIAWQKALEKQIPPENKMEEFFLEKIKREIYKDIAILEKQQQSSLLNQVKTEQVIKVQLDPTISLKGMVDKILYREETSHVYAAIVDYKTGSEDKINPSLFEYGLSLQLPIYVYLLQQGKMFDQQQLKIVGYYLQHIINDDLNYDEKKDAQQLKEESMRLQGFTSEDISRIGLIDGDLTSGNKSGVIKGLALKKDGTMSARALTFSDEDLQKQNELVEQKIFEAGKKILSGDFTINPKIVDNVNISCQYCPYYSICYRKEQDKQYLNLTQETVKGED